MKETQINIHDENSFQNSDNFKEHNRFLQKNIVTNKI